jgi:hypothetical protein
MRRPGATIGRPQRHHKTPRLGERDRTTMNDRQARDPKFVQITTSVLGSEILLYALDEAGDVWRFDDKTRQWVRLPRDRR